MDSENLQENCEEKEEKSKKLNIEEAVEEITCHAKPGKKFFYRTFGLEWGD